MPNLPSTTPTILEVLDHHEAELRARGMSADDARAKCELLTKRLGSRIRMLASAADAEVVSAARSAAEIMKSFGADFHAVADQVERRVDGAGPTNGVATKADIRKIYDQGYAAGVRDAENKRFGSSDFIDENGLPAWHEIALFCQRNIDRIKKPSECEFINDMAGKTLWREPTERQATWLKDIFLRLGGKIT
jgi:hypothetical protein